MSSKNLQESAKILRDLGIAVLHPKDCDDRGHQKYSHVEQISPLGLCHCPSGGSNYGRISHRRS